MLASTAGKVHKLSIIVHQHQSKEVKVSDERCGARRGIVNSRLMIHESSVALVYTYRPYRYTPRQIPKSYAWEAITQLAQLSCHHCLLKTAWFQFLLDIRLISRATLVRVKELHCSVILMVYSCLNTTQRRRASYRLLYANLIESPNETILILQLSWTNRMVRSSNSPKKRSSTSIMNKSPNFKDRISLERSL